VGHHGHEADYAFVWTDADGQPLAGANRYELGLGQLPPVDAFWSLTMYDVPDFYLVANPIDRYPDGSYVLPPVRNVGWRGTSGGLDNLPVCLVLDVRQGKV
jgi:hypothetical protein